MYASAYVSCDILKEILPATSMIQLLRSVKKYLATALRRGIYYKSFSLFCFLPSSPFRCSLCVEVCLCVYCLHACILCTRSVSRVYTPYTLRYGWGISRGFQSAGQKCCPKCSPGTPNAITSSAKQWFFQDRFSNGLSSEARSFLGIQETCLIL